MNKILFIFYTLLVLSSCHSTTDKEENKQVESTMEDSMQQPLAADAEKGKHITHNEAIESVDSNLKSFIPENYSALFIASGDLNKDEFPDKILVLGKNSEKEISASNEDKLDKRPLLILLGLQDSSFKLHTRNDNAIECIDCGGMFGDPFTGVSIKNGYFSLEHGIAGGQHWEKITTFKFNSATNNWFLYKDHFVSYKMNNDTSDDAEVLVLDIDKLETVKDFGNIPFDKYDTYKEDKK